MLIFKEKILSKNAQYTDQLVRITHCYVFRSHMIFDETTKPLDKTNRHIVAVVSTLVILVLAGLGYFKGGAYIVWAWIVGIPLGLLLLSLCFGKASKGNDVLSAFTLNIIGGLVGIGSVLAAMNGNHSAWAGIIFSVLILRLGKERRENKKT